MNSAQSAMSTKFSLSKPIRGFQHAHKRQQSFSPQQKKELEEAFLLFAGSDDKKGTIDMKELRAAMKALGYDAKKDELKKIRFEFDKEINEGVNLKEFMDIMSTRMSRHDSREESDRIFQLFDLDGTGFISFKNLRKVCQELGEEIDDKELQVAFCFLSSPISRCGECAHQP